MRTLIGGTAPFSRPGESFFAFLPFFCGARTRGDAGRGGGVATLWSCMGSDGEGMFRAIGIPLVWDLVESSKAGISLGLLWD